jgi:hypothetical protein
MPPILHAQIVERAGNDRLAAIDDRDVIGDLLDFGELMRREEHRRSFGGDVADERLQHFFGHRRIQA